MKTLNRRLLAILVSASLASATPAARAGMLPTDSVVSDRARVAAALERSDIRAALAAHGVNPAEAQRRVAALADDEVAQLAEKVDTLPAGGGSSLAGAIIFAFVIFIIIKIWPLILGGTVAYQVAKNSHSKPATREGQ